MAPDEHAAVPEQRVDDADFSNTRLHSPNFEGASITDGWLLNAHVSGYIEGLRINGVDVAPLVEAALDARYPERATLRAVDPSGFQTAWLMIEELWTRTVERARALPEPLLHERMDGEWSFVETLRHLIFATDSWLLHMVRGVPRPYHPLGLARSFLTEPASLGLDPGAQPTLEEVLVVRRERMEAVHSSVAGLTAEELQRTCVPPDGPGHPQESASVLECLRVILDEEWEHHRYATRDLALLERRQATRST
jgi:hypothetical protein